MNYIRVFISTPRKSKLKKLADAVNEFLCRQGQKFLFLPWYLSILDIIETKIFKEPTISPHKKSPKCIIPIFFHNKADFINIPTIIKSLEVIAGFPKKLKDKKIKHSLVYNLSPSIRSKIFNYKESVSSLNVEDLIKDINSLPRKCQDSKFTDQHHDHDF